VSAFHRGSSTPGLSVGPHDRRWAKQGAHTADVILRIASSRSQHHRRGRGSGFQDRHEGAGPFGRLHMGAIFWSGDLRTVGSMNAWLCQRTAAIRSPIGEIPACAGDACDSRTEALLPHAPWSPMPPPASMRARTSRTEGCLLQILCDGNGRRVADRRGADLSVGRLQAGISDERSTATFVCCVSMRERPNPAKFRHRAQYATRRPHRTWNPYQKDTGNMWTSLPAIKVEAANPGASSRVRAIILCRARSGIELGTSVATENSKHTRCRH